MYYICKTNKSKLRNYEKLLFEKLQDNPPHLYFGIIHRNAFNNWIKRDIHKHSFHANDISNKLFHRKVLS